MLRREFTRENRMEKFEEAYGRWKAGETGQRTAAVALGMSGRDVSALQAAPGGRRG